MTKTISLTIEQYYAQKDYSQVYRIGDIAIKCPFSSQYAGLEEEFEIQKRLFDAKINVPKPYEIVKARLEDREVYALAMQFVDGKRADTLNELIKIALKDLYLNELEKAITAGFIPFDEGLHNAIYSRKQGLVMIDFNGWKQKIKTTFDKKEK